MHYGATGERNHADLAKYFHVCVFVAGDSSGRKAEEEAGISETRLIYRL